MQEVTRFVEKMKNAKAYKTVFDFKRSIQLVQKKTKFKHPNFYTKMINKIY